MSSYTKLELSTSNGGGSITDGFYYEWQEVRVRINRWRVVKGEEREGRDAADEWYERD